MRNFFNLFAKKKIQVIVVNEPVPDFSKKMVIVETLDDEDEDDDKNDIKNN